MRKPQGRAEEPALAPGMGATTVHACGIWTDVFSLLTKIKSRLAAAFHSARTKPSEKRAPSGRVWPCPLPFPEMHRRRANRQQRDTPRKLALNFVVLVMNLFHNGQTHFARAVPGLGTPLNYEQWTFVKRMTPLIDQWNAEPAVTSVVMGRSAAKVESVETLLEQAVKPLAADLKGYLGKSSSGLQTSWGHRGDPGVVVGHLSSSLEHVAKSLQPERLKFWKVPTFDAAPFLDEENRSRYLEPYSHLLEFEDGFPAPPRVRVRIAERDKVRFLKLLDATDRLSFAAEGEIKSGYENGAFAVPKDGSRDRMVLDARPPNLLEQAERRWIRSLGSVSQLQHFFLPAGHKLVMHAEDLREFYHAFRISRQRELRNSFKMRVSPAQVQELKAFSRSFWQYDTIVPLLATMAMGDLNAVAIAQTAHLGVLLQRTSLQLSDFITLKQRPQRSSWFAGLMIDDLILGEVLPYEAPNDSGECTNLMSTIHDAYVAVGLPRHEGKSVQGSSSCSFWGVTVSGEEGWARPNLSRAVPLAFLLLEVCKLGHASVGLLEVLAGSLVSIFSLKRRFMSALEEIYAAQRGRSRDSIVQISGPLKDELLCCIALTALSHIDFRVEASEFLVASDASSSAEAAVVAEIPSFVTEEMQKHSLAKGLWSRLLRPEQAYRREKSSLPDDEQLPDETYSIHPLWQEACETLQFRQLGKTKKVSSRRHINLGEIDAALQAELEVGKRQPRKYYVHLQDSQVSLAALQKGRSSSTEINKRLKSSIPHHVHYQTRAFYGFVASAFNPSDDPTRGRAVRAPQWEPQPWFDDMMQGSFEKLDEMLFSHGLHPRQVAELPDEAELLERVPLDLRSSKLKRKQARAKVHKSPPDAVPHDGFSSVREGPIAKAETPKEAETPKAQKFCKGEERRGLSEDQISELLQHCSRSQFQFNEAFDSLEEALRSGRGVLELYAGVRGFSKAAVKYGFAWSLSYDIKHSASEDLSLAPLQQLLLGWIRGSFFAAMGAGPVCASFSTAITPPCRNCQFPEGVPWCSPLQQAKNAAGNDQLRFVLEVVLACIKSDVRFWVENPDGSWIWKQRGALSWKAVLAHETVGDFRVDYCRFGTAWRKRTRFRTDLHLKGQSCFCTCGRRHVVLRGRCKERKMNFTRLAEAYPRPLASLLGAAAVIDAGVSRARRTLDVAACARCVGRCIGEALTPGPRRSILRDPELSLADVNLLEPGTIAIRSRMWHDFSVWADTRFGRDSLDGICAIPSLLVQVLIAFGFHCFEANVSLHYFRQLLAHVQREVIGVRAYMAPAWEVCSKWESLEPTQHRPPLPEPILRAMATLGLAWGWKRWVASLLFSFFAAARVGEVLRAKRKHLLTPFDLLTDQQVIYLQIESPKTRRRGARMQYVTVDEPLVLQLACSVWQNLEAEDWLFPLSAGAFRSRWNAVLRHLKIGPEHRLTPGSLRAGGAVFLHRNGISIADLLWRMRLQHVKTLSYYLQEVTASSILPSLKVEIRKAIQLLQVALPFFISLQTRPAAHNQCPAVSASMVVGLGS